MLGLLIQVLLDYPARDGILSFHKHRDTLQTTIFLKTISPWQKIIVEILATKKVLGVIQWKRKYGNCVIYHVVVSDLKTTSAFKELITVNVLQLHVSVDALNNILSTAKLQH